jgi:hypothetical protein
MGRATRPDDTNVKSCPSTLMQGWLALNASIAARLDFAKSWRKQS